jgi:hypothetical protein
MRLRRPAILISTTLSDGTGHGRRCRSGMTQLVNRGVMMAALLTGLSSVALAETPTAAGVGGGVVCGIIHTDSAQCPRPRPTAQMYVGYVTGAGRKQKQVQRVLSSNKIKLNYCYQKFQLVDAKLAGLLKADVTINNEGAVTAVTATGIESTVRDDLVACVSKVLTQLTFPRLGKNDVVITIPMKLTLIK